MSQDSAPGKDGLPMEFYQSFLHLKIEDSQFHILCTERNEKNNENSDSFAYS